MDELISKEQALKVIADYQGGSVNKVVAKELLEALPARQPTYIPIATIQLDRGQMFDLIDMTIVRCGDCVYGQVSTPFGDPEITCICGEGMYRDVCGDDFCSSGIRRAK